MRLSSPPSRPTEQRGKTHNQIRFEVAAAIGVQNRGNRHFRDYAGRSVLVPARLLINHLSQKANHAAYASWVQPTLESPLEVWIHADTGHYSSNRRELRLHYFGAYIGPVGGTSHMVVAVALDPKGPKLINAFSLTRFATADKKRFGTLDHISYDPHSTPRKAKGATPTYRIAPLP